jgi:chemotaxis protein histidine kinase CheA
MVAEELARRKVAKEQVLRKVEEQEEAKRKAAEQAARQKAAAEEAARQKKAAEEEAARQRAAEEEALRRAAEAEALRMAAEEEARRKAAEEEAARMKLLEEEEARRLAAEQEEAARQRAAAEEKAAQLDAERARRLAEEAAEMAEMDERCVLTFLECVKPCSSWRDSRERLRTPIKGTILYTKHMRPCRPAGTSVDVKDSTFRCLGNFLQFLEAEGLLRLKPGLTDPVVTDICTNACRSYTYVPGKYVPAPPPGAVQEASSKVTVTTGSLTALPTALTAEPANRAAVFTNVLTSSGIPRLWQ